MKEVLQHLEYGKILIYFSLAAIILTYLTHLIFKKYKFVKYIPGFIFMFAGLYFLYDVGTDFTTSDSLDGILFFMVGFIAGIIGMLSALIIGIFNKEKKVKKKDKEQ